MYNKVECITLSCDNCGEIYQDEDGSGFSIWVSESDASDSADNDGWYLHGDDEKHYCPECHDINDNDELVIDMTRTKPLDWETKEAENTQNITDFVTPTHPPLPQWEADKEDHTLNSKEIFKGEFVTDLRVFVVTHKPYNEYEVVDAIVKGVKQMDEDSQTVISPASQDLK